MLGPTAEFRDGQWEAIDLAANHRQRVLVVQRTGWGKSVVYFLAAKILRDAGAGDRKSTRLNSSHLVISYAVFCLKKKNSRHTAWLTSPEGDCQGFVWCGSSGSPRYLFGHVRPCVAAQDATEWRKSFAPLLNTQAP